MFYLIFISINDKDFLCFTFNKIVTALRFIASGRHVWTSVMCYYTHDSTSPCKICLPFTGSVGEFSTVALWVIFALAAMKWTEMWDAWHSSPSFKFGNSHDSAMMHSFGVVRHRFFCTELLVLRYAGSYLLLTELIKMDIPILSFFLSFPRSGRRLFSLSQSHLDGYTL